MKLTKKTKNCYDDEEDLPSVVSVNYSRSSSSDESDPIGSARKTFAKAFSACFTPSCQYDQNNRSHAQQGGSPPVIRLDFSNNKLLSPENIEVKPPLPFKTSCSKQNFVITKDDEHCEEYESSKNVSLKQSISKKEEEEPKKCLSHRRNLSGSWKIIVHEEFKSQYDVYLKVLGFGRILRALAIKMIHKTVEEIKDSPNGEKLWIKSINPKGIWERTLLDRLHKVKTAEREEVMTKSRWDGSRHISFLYNIKKYSGADFESIRYIDENGFYICESKVHPKTSKIPKATLTWRFQKMD
jgi:hypothetical protein